MKITFVASSGLRVEKSSQQSLKNEAKMEQQKQQKHEQIVSEIFYQKSTKNIAKYTENMAKK